ncbi:MAG: hypothetical protein ACRYGC_01625 [Janthinobacterium lividum]
MAAGSDQGPRLNRAPDPTATGPYATTSSEYKLPAGVDPEVDATVVTELWARIYRPATLGNGKHPLVVILHGNHGTCGHYVDGTIGRVDSSTQYTTLGTCPDGFIVTPNHLGYEYMATKLASWGYIVVSINANRGVTAAAAVPGDSGLNLRRGRLVLRHIEQLAAWNRSGGAPDSLGFNLKGTIDFKHVGLMGHSRGGEGQLAAYTMYFDPGSPWPARIGDPVKFEALFELAPVDGQTGRTFVANNIPWTVLLPVCDGDVNTLQGVRVYDRTIDSLTETKGAIKTVYAVWGANHNFFNTQWQTSDSKGCTGTGNTPLFDQVSAGSATEQQTGLFAFLAMMRGYVGPYRQQELANLLDPRYALPPKLTALSMFERSFSEAAKTGPSAVIDDFTSPDGTSSSGQPNQAARISTAHLAVQNHDVTLTSQAIAWQLPSVDPSGAYFQANWTAPGVVNPVPYETLEFRVALQCNPISSTNPCGATSLLNVAAVNDFSIALALPDGTLSRSVRLSDYATLQGPVGGGTQNLHPILETVRIPLADFVPAPTQFGAVAAPPTLRGVRFIFDRTASGAVSLANLRLSRPVGVYQGLVADVADKAGLTAQPASLQVAAEPAPAVIGAAQGRVMALSRTTAMAEAGTAATAAAATPMVDIELQSQAAIPVRDSLLTLMVDGREETLSRFGTDGDTRHVIFSVPQADFDAIPDGAPLVLRNGQAASGFGALRKSMLR